MADHVNAKSDHGDNTEYPYEGAKGEDADEELPHAEVVDIFQEGLAMLVQDPLLCDLPIQVTVEEINSQIALEFGQAMTVRVCKANGDIMPVVVVQNATVLDLKKAIQRYIQLKHQREGGIQHISWKYVWRTYQLSFSGEKLDNDEKNLCDNCGNIGFWVTSVNVPAFAEAYTKAGRCLMVASVLKDNLVVFATEGGNKSFHTRKLWPEMDFYE